MTVLYLANNRIQSISSLEDSDWIKQFSLLSLQGNLLKEVSSIELPQNFKVFLSVLFRGMLGDYIME